MFTVQELVAQGYTVQHARQFTSREAVQVKNVKAAHKARKNGRAELAQAKRARVNAATDGSDYADPKVVAQEQAAHPEDAFPHTTVTRNYPTMQEQAARGVTNHKTAVIRAWAVLNGHKVKAGGRLSKAIIHAYDVAHEAQKS